MSANDVDIHESILRQSGGLLDILLKDHTTKKNIIWATDSYELHGKQFTPLKQIKPALVTGVYERLIQPRAIKSSDEQRRRTKDKGEVFTPLKIVDQMNKQLDWTVGTFPVSEATWQTYVQELRLEISCGEAPFIVSRYNPVAHGTLIKLENRVGFLDRKLKIVSEFCHKPKEWLKWAKVAYQSSYGYEWQGDSILIARENLLYTLMDYYKAKFHRRPPLAIQQEFAEIISWNIFQMDGLKYVVPMSCNVQEFTIPRQTTLFGERKPIEVIVGCEGCVSSNPEIHNGKYVKVMDWQAHKSIRFVKLLKNNESIG